MHGMFVWLIKKTKQANAMHQHARGALAACHSKKNQGQKSEIQPN